MQEYSTTTELIQQISKTAQLFIDEFDTVSENDRNTIIEGVDRTPVQMIAYQLGWLDLLMAWDKKEAQGELVITPSDGYRWNNLGGLYQSFYDTYNGYTLKELKNMFTEKVNTFLNWVAHFSEEELFTSNTRKWASSTPSNWPIWKWVHINSVAPFKSFRTKIRKWKKLNNQQSSH